MTRDVPEIQFTLLENALDSIERAVDLLAWKDVSDPNSRLKQAILLIAQSVELLLKERLRRVHPSLIWEDVDKYPKLDARTVGAERAILRLRQIGGVNVSDADFKIVKAIRSTRNAIEHFHWRMTQKEADTIVAQSLSFAIHFAKTELNTEIAFRFKNDDTWDRLLHEHVAFARTHADRLISVAEVNASPIRECPYCHALAQDSVTSACSVCGHWESLSEFDDGIPF